MHEALYYIRNVMSLKTVQAEEIIHFLQEQLKEMIEEKVIT